MKNLILPLNYALIRPQHWQAATARAGDLAKHLQRTRADASEDNPAAKPWWKVMDLWGDPLPAPAQLGGTAVIPVKGVITSGMPTIFRAIHYADTAEIAGWVRAAAADPEVAQIVLQIDSPGGMVAGTPELAEEVAAADLRKPVLAHSAGMMDSAAYWIASQARAVFCTPSADVGCIGVCQVNYDESAWLEEMGIKAEMFKSGDLKGAGHPAISLSDAQRAHIQSEIDAIGAQFRAAVTAKRTLVQPDSMRGQSFIGTEAAARGLVGGLRSFASLL